MMILGISRHRATHRRGSGLASAEGWGRVAGLVLAACVCWPGAALGQRPAEPGPAGDRFDPLAVPDPSQPWGTTPDGLNWPAIEGFSTSDSMGRSGPAGQGAGECCPACGAAGCQPLPGCWPCSPCPGRRLFGLFGCGPVGDPGVGNQRPREGWLYRPASVGLFVGVLNGSPLIDDWVGQKQGVFGGLRLGWDYDDYWGFEGRYGIGSVELFDSQRVIDARQAADDQRQLAANDPLRQRFDKARHSDRDLFDFSVLFYPWGDTRWRPYLAAGVGIVEVRFADLLRTRYSKSLIGMPLAVGIKYHCTDRLALRLDCADNIAFGGDSGFNTLHDLTFTGGMEIHFGGPTKAYWPWNPGYRYW